MTVLVTGASGFVGGRLVRALRQHLPAQTRLIGWDRSPAVDAAEGVEWRAVDLTDAAAVDAAIADARPAQVFHLAALSSVGQAQGAARATHDVNVGGTFNLAEALRRHSPGTGVIFASSGEIYGGAFAAGAPLAEGASVLPLNSYARSKLAAEFVLHDRLADACPVVALRLLNHTGAGQDERFVVPTFAAQIARIEKGLHPPQVHVGNLAAERDFLDVDDVIDAYVRAFTIIGEAPGFRVFNVASGAPRSIASILDRLVALA
ncbi:MAG: NAD-dependent epimerase/dehydratase family protein, partial [Rhizobiaceae bacterium]